MNSLPYWKITATVGGLALTACAVALNASHVAASDGWTSPLVASGIVVTICAAAALPIAERCAKEGQPLKAVALWIFFLLAVCFSLTASISRAGGHRDAEVAGNEAQNTKAKLAGEGYQSALAARDTECKSGRGNRCRNAEAGLEGARKALAGMPAARAADPGAERVAAVLGVSEASVALYSPLALPLGLELGGFVFLAVGLAPRRRKAEAVTLDLQAEPVKVEVAKLATSSREAERARDSRGRFRALVEA
jgi:hypothetical protein